MQHFFFFTLTLATGQDSHTTCTHDHNQSCNSTLGPW